MSNTNRYHRPPEETEEEFTAFLLDELERTIQRWGPRRSAMVHHGADPERRRRRSSPPAGYWKGVRELCDRYGILLWPTR